MIGWGCLQKESVSAITLKEPIVDYAFVGGGVMGGALIRALIENRVSAPNSLLVVEPYSARREAFSRLGCRTAEALRWEIGEAKAVVLAVKPQQAESILAELKSLLDPKAVVVSIMAGVRCGTIAAGLGSAKVIRSMPNLPASVGEGMSAYYAPEELPPEDCHRAERLLAACGKVLRVAQEDMLDMFTAVAGSGPAYVYYLAEHWVAAAQELGFEETQAKTMVMQTLRGAAALWEKKNLEAGELRQQVSSKGGTTEAAMAVLNEKGVGDAIRLAVKAAHRRAIELGG